MTAKNFWGALPFSSGFCLDLVGGVDINCRIVALGFIFFSVYQDIFYQDFFLHLLRSTLYINRINYIIYFTYTKPAYDRRSTAPTS